MIFVAPQSHISHNFSLHRRYLDNFVLAYRQDTRTSLDTYSFSAVLNTMHVNAWDDYNEKKLSKVTMHFMIR